MADGPLFIVDNGSSGCNGLAYLREWSELASSIDHRLLRDRLPARPRWALAEVRQDPDPPRALDLHPELLALLAILEQTVDLTPRAADLLDRVVARRPDRSRNLADAHRRRVQGSEGVSGVDVVGLTPSGLLGTAEGRG